MAEPKLCIQCDINITGRSHAVACAGCGRWNHRKCGTDISHQQYLQLRRGNISIAWKCVQCETQSMDWARHNSTAMEKEVLPTMDLDVSPMRTIDVSRRDTIPDVMFDVLGQEFHGPTSPLEESLPDNIPDDSLTTYEIVEAGTKRGAPKLISTDGYTYTRGVKVGERRYWRCAVRNKAMVCPASVKEFKGIFTPGLGGHVHPADPGAAQKVKITKKVKELAKERLMEPAAAIVDRVMRDMVTDNDINLPKHDNLTRAANHHRRLRLDDPIMK